MPSPSSPPSAPRTSPDTGADARIAALQDELEAESEPTRQAALHYEIGHLTETHHGRDAQAVRSYLEAYNLDPSFHPPLFALVRVFERRRSFKNLMRLYEAEAQSAATHEEQASALVDQGVLLEDHRGQPDGARTLYRRALRADGSHLSASLMLEKSAREAAQAPEVLEALRARADRTRDPTLKALLLSDLGIAHEQLGDVDAALQAFQQAASLPAGRARALEHLERVARRHGQFEWLASALEQQAEVSHAAATGDEPGQMSGAHSMQRAEGEDAALARAAALWRGAAQLRLSRLDDPPRAIALLDRALELRPRDPLLRQEHMLACEIHGELSRVADDARALLEQTPSGPFAAALHFRIAELRQSEGHAEGARQQLEAALEADPDSATALATLEDLLLDMGAHDERVQRLETGAQTMQGSARALALWRAAQIASESLGDFERARPLYEGALASAEDRAPLLREFYGAARRHGDYEAARKAVQRLLAEDVDEEERGALLHEAFELAHQASDPGSARQALLTALEQDAATGWAPDAARLHGAWTGDTALVTQAHEALAERARKDETVAAHLCAAARSLLRQGETDRATEMLRRALERVPGHRYAVGALEEILRERGEADEVVSLLRDAAAAQQGSETSLLLAGAAAEAAGDTALARQTYQEAADLDPTAVAPLWSLRRLAERTEDQDLLHRTLLALSEREIATGEPARATLELGEYYDLVAHKPNEAAPPLQTATEGNEVAGAAAVDLLTLPGSAVPVHGRLAALDRLLEQAPEADRPPLLRELGATALASGSETTRAMEVAEKLAEAQPDDRWASYARLRVATSSPDGDEPRADAWVGFGQQCEEPESGAELVLHGLRAKMMASGQEAADDAFILAHEIAETHPDSPAASVALDETLSGGDDPEAHAQALEGRLRHSGQGGHAELQAAWGRALLAAGRPEQAADVLRRVVQADDADLASWEALRVAAREAAAWEDVVAACDRLARELDGELAAELREEAGAVLMDHLGRDAEAEQRLRAALQDTVQRPIAYGRLHDLLSEREDTTSLLELVSRRLQVEEDPQDLERLYYEQARLLRSEGDREGALRALDQLLLLDEQHAGALALAVEINVSLERYDGAVEMLRSLAQADVPSKQKRLARLGAADFLDKQLGDPAGAIEELRQVEKLGLADTALLTRMADLAERAGSYDQAAAALERATELGRSDQAAPCARRAAALRRDQLGDVDGAIASYRRALHHLPTDLDAGEALASLLEREQRREFADEFERQVRQRLLASDPTDPDTLRRLRAAARWKGDRDLEHVVLQALATLGLAGRDELDRAKELAGELEKRRPKTALGAQQLGWLRAGSDDEATAELVRELFEPLAAHVGLDPGGYGVGRGELVSPRKESEVRDEIHRIASLVGLPAGEFYQGGHDPERIAVVPGRRDKPAWIAGTRVQVPLTADQRYQVAKLAFAMGEWTLPWIDRRASEAADLLFGAAEAAGAPLAQASGRAAVRQHAQALERLIARRTRRRIAELVPRIPRGGANLEAHFRTARRNASRVGLFLSGALTAALHDELGTRPDRETVQASEPARELLTFWLSKTTLALRSELGWSL